MADYKGYVPASMKAGKNLSSYQYVIVTDVTANANYCQNASASTQWPIGVLQDTPGASGEGATVAVAGACFVKLGGKVTSGSCIVPNASGWGVSAQNTGSCVVGRALYGGSTNDIIPVVLCSNPPQGSKNFSNK